MMNTWAKDELNKIAETDDLHISPLREDGKTYGTPTWIWSVVVDGALYVRGIQRTKISLVPSGDSAESGTNHCRRHHEGGRLSSRSTARSTTASMKPTQRSTRAARISNR